MKHYKTGGRKFLACNIGCANAFKADRKAGVIYGPLKYLDGTWAKNQEEASCRLFSCAYCGHDGVLEIKSGNGAWCHVTDSIFRSWSGKRRIDGQPYTGPVFLFGTFTETTTTPK